MVQYEAMKAELNHQICGSAIKSTDSFWPMVIVMYKTEIMINEKHGFS